MKAVEEGGVERTNWLSLMSCTAAQVELVMYQASENLRRRPASIKEPTSGRRGHLDTPAAAAAAIPTLPSKPILTTTRHGSYGALLLPPTHYSVILSLDHMRSRSALLLDPACVPVEAKHIAGARAASGAMVKTVDCQSAGIREVS